MLLISEYGVPINNAIIDSSISLLAIGSRGGTPTLPDRYTGAGNIDLTEPSPTGDGIAAKIRSQVAEAQARPNRRVYSLFDGRNTTKFT